MTVDINPKVLKWAREESGYLLSDVVKKLQLENDIYLEWENNGQGVPFNVLRDIARTFKRQVAVFFLPQAPTKLKRPKDYRNLKSELSFNTLLAIRRARKFQDVLVELNGVEYYPKKYEWLSEYQREFANSLHSHSDIAAWIRQKLKYTIDDQKNDKTIEHTYGNWRSTFETNLGINVFQFKLPAKELQGFCYCDTHPFCIVVNSEYSVASRIFTLFHELGHILRKQSGLCLPDNVVEDDPIEWELNTFAGNVLLPETVVIPIHDKDKIFTYSRKLKVSSEVYLRRCRTLGLVTDAEFFFLLAEIRKSVKSTKGFGIATPIQKSMNSRGQTLFNSVLDGIQQNSISYGRASDILGIKVNHLLTV